MARATQKTKLSEAQEKLKNAATTSETIKLDPTPISNNNTHQATVFNPSDYLATNLFSDSSTLPRTTKVEADTQIQSISEKRETLRLVGANLQLNTDVYKTGSLSEKMSQSNITWQTDRIGTDTKLIGLETAKVTHQIAEVKLGQTQEKLTHAGIELTGLQGETPLRQAFWVAKLSLIESRIAQVELAKFQLDAKIGAIESEAESIN